MYFKDRLIRALQTDGILRIEHTILISASFHPHDRNDGALFMGAWSGGMAPSTWTLTLADNVIQMGNWLLGTKATDSSHFMINTLGAPQPQVCCHGVTFKVLALLYLKNILFSLTTTLCAAFATDRRCILVWR